MKVLKWLLIVIVVLALAFLAFLWYLGVFSTPKVTEMQMGPYALVYEDYVGPYSGVVPVLERVYKAVSAEGIATTQGFGIYLDNPKTTPPDKLRSQLGYVIEPKDLGKALQGKLKVQIWKKGKALVAEFPIKNNLSYMIGPMKAYPELNKALAAKGYTMGKCLELYDPPAKKILFVFEIKK